MKIYNFHMLVKNKRILRWAIQLYFLCWLSSAFCQNNLVPNYSFEDITDCDIEWGQIDKASPWIIIEESPDLYHTCSTNPFYKPPFISSCQTISPKTGEAMGGLVNAGLAEERIFTWFTEDLPLGVDIYVAFYTLPSGKCGNNPYSILCYSNTLCLAFADANFSREVILESDEVFNNKDEWTRLHTCYRASGEEKMVLIGNYKASAEVKMECESIDVANYAYSYVDDIIVAPFDVVPDTIFLCKDEPAEFDIIFYEVDIQWRDGWMGGRRTITEAGRYTVQGDVGDCFMEDQVIVIDLEENEVETVSMCKKGDVLLEAPVPANWNNGATAYSIQVSQPGIYTAEFMNGCGSWTKEFIVTEVECKLDYYVPNVFSPNDDGVNDKVEFFFRSEFPFTGELLIYDRWGQQIYQQKGTDQLTWDGTYKGQALNPQVFVWIYKYTSTKEEITRVISGDITLVR